MHQYAVLGTAALLAGRPAAAVEALGRAWRTARAIGIREPGRRLRLDLDLAEALVAAGDPDAARTLAADLHALADSTGRPGPLALALHVDGLVAAAAGDLAGAAELLTRVLGLATPYPVERARALLALGRTLRRARARRRAADRLAEAERLFTAAGAAGWARRAAEELRRTSARPARGEPGDGLTDTERRVAELVAAGRSNREVASELVVSVRTVEGHLAAVYRKLQVSGRTALAARTGGFSDPTADRFG
jgi:ATP/maltotriose-dependent transcriptional regulator MalT